jgi:hypothetical protein
MWLPYLLESVNAAEMQAMGLEIPVSEIYSINQSSLKDAIVSFGGFCTGEVISGQGLVLTNHHCGYEAIQSHSSVANDYLTRGFWAQNHAGELANKGLFVTFIRSMEDVTNAIVPAAAYQGASRDSVVQFNITQLVEQRKASTGKDYMVRAFFYGNQFILFETETFRDVRLVGAPPSFIGKYGADTDNWVWPRHTGDFSMFRIYASPDNQPANYSTENVPYKSPRHLEIELGGTPVGAMTLVYGFPGRTQSYLPAMALKQTLYDLNPVRIQIRDISLGIMDQRMRTSDAVRIKYAAKYASTANAWKKWKGESLGLRASKAVTRREELDQQVVEALKAKSNPTPGPEIYTQLQEVYRSIGGIEMAVNRFSETFLRGTEDLAFLMQLRTLNKALVAADAEAVSAQVKRLKPRAQGFFEDYDPDLAQSIFAALVENYVNTEQQFPIAALPATTPKGGWPAWTQKMYEGSSLLSLGQMEQWLQLAETKPSKAAAQLKRDPMVQLAFSLADAYEKQLLGPFQALDGQRQALLGQWMQARKLAEPERNFYPDANSTLRLAYGRLEGFSPADAITYQPYTRVEGVLEKYIPGDYEFDLDERYRQLIEARDFGRFEADGSLPVCFLASNHTTGGNSGSPVLNGRGRLIGLNFDRCWEGTMSDLNYDISLCRNIAVDVRYILWVVEKYAGAGYLLEEMTLVKNSAP